MAYGTLANVHQAKGEYTEALKCLDKVLAINKRIGDKVIDLSAYVNIGNAYYNQNQFEKAITYYEKAIKLNADKINNTSTEGTIYINYGNAQLELGNLKQAFELQQKAIVIGRSNNEPTTLFQAHLNLMHYYLKKKDFENAYHCCKEALEIGIGILGDILEEFHRISFSEKVSSAYFYIIVIGLELNYRSSAFYYLEQSKSGALITLLSNLDYVPRFTSNPSITILLQKEKKILSVIKAIQIRHLQSDPSIIEPGTIAQLELSLEEVYQVIEQYDKNYVATRKGRNLSFQEVQKLLET